MSKISSLVESWGSNLTIIFSAKDTKKWNPIVYKDNRLEEQKSFFMVGSNGGSSHLRLKYGKIKIALCNPPVKHYPIFDRPHEFTFLYSIKCKVLQFHFEVSQGSSIFPALCQA